MLLTAIVSRRPGTSASGETFNRLPRHHRLEIIMANAKGPNIKKKQKCKNCEGKGLLKKGDKVVKCQRCGGTGVR
jgi:DnaJ-class molecular chaperone